MSSPTQRSLKYMRKEGYTVDVVERWIPKANVRKDLFGCIDLVALHPGIQGVIGIQTTSYTNISARIKKILANEIMILWLNAGNLLFVHGWKKKKNGRYELITRQITKDMFYDHDII